MLNDADFSSKARVDRYGRKVASDSGKRELERFYRLDDDEDENGEESDGNIASDRFAKTKIKSKRLTSEGKRTKGIPEHSRPAGSEEDSLSDEDRVDDDETVAKELRRVDKEYDPARDGGFSTSSSDGSEESDEDDAQLEGTEIKLPHEAEVPTGEASSRLAVVNLDWDNVKSVDLLAVASSFAPSSGRILNVAIYPSEFGQQQMEVEAQKGPPPELFANGVNKQAPNRANEDYSDGSELHASESEDSDEQDERIKNKLLAEDNNEEYSSTALRAYQLERLRYYYAVITCSSTSTARGLYEAMDGREYLSSANFFDLRFVPDNVSFDDDKPRDSCRSVPDGYRPTEFVTDALTRSKVKLTWDADDRDRREVQKRAFSRAEIDENDLMAYVGSASSSEGEGIPVSEKPFPNEKSDDKLGETADADEEQSKSSRVQKASALRAALGLSTANKTDGPSTKKEKNVPVGDLQVTWTPALMDAPKRDSVFVNAPEETTRERYVRKEKERKARRKEKLRAARAGMDGNAVSEDAADQEDVTSNSHNDNHKTTTTDEHKNEDKSPFADPFFTDPVAATAAEKKARRTAKEARRAALATATGSGTSTAAEKAELELLMQDDDIPLSHPDPHSAEKVNNTDDPTANATPLAANPSTMPSRHFDMNAIIRAEKAERRKVKKSRKSGKSKGSKDESKTETDGDVHGGTRNGGDGGRDGGRDEDEDDHDHDKNGAFRINVTDPRFAALYENHEYAIDPTSAKFKGTVGMRALLEEGRRRRRGGRGETTDDGMDEGGIGEGVDDVKVERRDRKEKKRKRDRASGRDDGGLEKGDGIDVGQLVAKFKRRRGT